MLLFINIFVLPAIFWNIKIPIYIPWKIRTPIWRSPLVSSRIIQDLDFSSIHRELARVVVTRIDYSVVIPRLLCWKTFFELRREIVFVDNFNQFVVSDTPVSCCAIYRRNCVRLSCGRTCFVWVVVRNVICTTYTSCTIAVALIGVRFLD